jgi:F0F1-type ATP synthase beta subunit
MDERFKFGGNVVGKNFILDGLISNTLISMRLDGKTLVGTGELTRMPRTCCRFKEREVKF